MAKTVLAVRGMKNTSLEFREALFDMAARNGWNVDAIAAVMSSESGLQANARNPLPGSASGLIQFLDSTAKGLGIAGGSAQVVQMSGVEQLPYVEAYYKRAFANYHQIPRTVDFYLAGWGEGIGKPLDYVLAKKDSPLVFSGGTQNKYTLNAGLDVNQDGVITVGDLDSRLQSIIRAANGVRLPAESPLGGGALPPLSGSESSGSELTSSGEPFRPQENEKWQKELEDTQTLLDETVGPLDGEKQ